MAETLTCARCGDTLHEVDLEGKRIIVCLECKMFGDPNRNLWKRLTDEEVQSLEGQIADEALGRSKP
jgi:hypothetical protein